MGQEFFIKSTNLEDKVKQLLPSQGGLGAGFDLSASTQIIPIVDLTESAEGSNLRQDLQSAFTLNNANSFFVTNATTTLISNTGFWRLYGNSIIQTATATRTNSIDITDGVTTGSIWRSAAFSGGTAGQFITVNFDVLIKLAAGDSLLVTSALNGGMGGAVRQIADIDGNLINP
jgi:hypothetical protein